MGALSVQEAATVKRLIHGYKEELNASLKGLGTKERHNSGHRQDRQDLLQRESHGAWRQEHDRVKRRIPAARLLEKKPKKEKELCRVLFSGDGGRPADGVVVVAGTRRDAEVELLSLQESNRETLRRLT